MIAIGEQDTQNLTGGLFIAVVLLTIAITFWASRKTKTASDYYAGGRSFSGFQNGLAVSGDYMSAASFLGISGAIALTGYDGFLYSIGFLVAWLVALLLVAELLRNSGRFTMADQLAFRMRQARPYGGGDVDRRRVDLLPARADGRCRRARRAVAGRDQRDRQEPHHRRSRRADDLLRGGRRHEGHHLGADRQGRPADDRHDPHHGAGAGEVQLQPLRPARHGRRQQRPGLGVPGAGSEVRRERRRARSTSSRSASRSCSAPPDCRTS